MSRRLHLVGTRADLVARGEEIRRRILAETDSEQLRIAADLLDRGLVDVATGIAEGVVLRVRARKDPADHG